MASVGVVIGTFGDLFEWVPLVQRASASVEAQTWVPDFIKWEHADTLQHARNYGAGSANTDWLVFLDADDELHPRYLETMMAVAELGEADIIQPSTLGVYPDGSEDDFPVLIPKRDLSQANYLVIGSMCRATTFMNVGGFEDLPCLEDWDLWQRMVLAGAKVAHAPEAIYRVHVTAGSRNSDERLHGEVYAAIQNRYRDAWVGVAQ